MHPIIGREARVQAARRLAEEAAVGEVRAHEGHAAAESAFVSVRERLLEARTAEQLAVTRREVAEAREQVGALDAAETTAALANRAAVDKHREASEAWGGYTERRRGDPMQLVGVPKGCLARPNLVADGDGAWRLPRDRSRRVKLTTVELSSADPGQTQQPPDGADRRFLLGRQSRRWLTIVEHYGTAEAAWAAAVANLRPTSDGLIARQLIERAQARLPTHLTTRDLACGTLQLSAGSEVFACENPRVLEAAVDRGVTAPLICTAGNPTTVTIGLLRQLGENARICYRGDFDWPGIAIANRVIRHTGCGTWRYDAASYCTAVAAAGGDLVPLTGRPTDAAWDSTLAGAMITAGAAVHEELMLGELVAYLAER